MSKIDSVYPLFANSSSSNDTHSEKLFELKDEEPLVVPLLSGKQRPS